MWKAFGALEQAYAALRELYGSLEDKVSDRTQALESALNRARDADRLKSAFLATMSHELRTPLNSIIGFTGIVLQGMAGPLTPEQQRQLGMVRGSARHLLDLINDVLDLSKIEAGQLQVRAEAFNISDSIQKVVGLVLPLADQKGLQLQVEIAPDVGGMYSDRRRVEQILINLLNNAIKFTDDGGAVVQVTLDPAFRVNADAPECRALRVQVRDTGIGIKPEDLGTLFQPFSQIDSGLTRVHEGTGLGLAICSRLVKLLGGTITVRSVWSEGSVFTVTIPLEMS
jgi:signal transduction histidine kinase